MQKQWLTYCLGIDERHIPVKANTPARVWEEMVFAPCIEVTLLEHGQLPMLYHPWFARLHGLIGVSFGHRFPLGMRLVRGPLFLLDSHGP